MEKQYKILIVIVVALSLLLLSVIVFSEPEKSSLIKLKLQAENTTAKYKTFDNNHFVGSLSSYKPLKWKRETGFMKIIVREKEGLSEIELNVTAHKIYEIKLYQNKFETKENKIYLFTKHNILLMALGFITLIIIYFMLKKRKENTPRLFSSKINLSHLTKLLNKENLAVEKINVIRKLQQGYSGSRIFLAEIFYKNIQTTNFAVIKVESKNQHKNDLAREILGYKAILEFWVSEIKEHLPQNSFLFPNIINNRKMSNLLFSSFADEQNTKNVETLREGLTTQFDTYSQHFENIKQLYQIQFQNFDNTNKEFQIPFTHFSNILEFKMKKITKFAWHDFEIDKTKKSININGKLFPNIIYYLNKGVKLWNDTAFSIFYFTIHGDLNLDNIIIKSDGKFVLIDFEKARKNVFSFDFAFLLTWSAQTLMIENSKNKDWKSLLNFIPQIVNYIKNPRKKLDSFPEVTNFKNILQKLYPLKKDISQNSVKAFQLSLMAATLLRAFYEFRDYSKSSKNIQNKKNGLFFYALACQLLDNPDFIINTEVSTKDAFDLPFLE